MPGGRGQKGKSKQTQGGNNYGGGRGQQLTAAQRKQLDILASKSEKKAEARKTSKLVKRVSRELVSKGFAPSNASGTASGSLSSQPFAFSDTSSTDDSSDSEDDESRKRRRLKKQLQATATSNEDLRKQVDELKASLSAKEKLTTALEARVSTPAKTGGKTINIDYDAFIALKEKYDSKPERKAPGLFSSYLKRQTAPTVEQKAEVILGTLRKYLSQAAEIEAFDGKAGVIEDDEFATAITKVGNDIGVCFPKESKQLAALHEMKAEFIASNRAASAGGILAAMLRSIASRGLDVTAEELGVSSEP